MNRILQGDCLVALASLPSESVDLVYLDPPFFTQRDHSLSTRDGSSVYGFSDTWPSRSDYIAFIEKALIECRRVLKDSGSIFLHCDTAANWSLRTILNVVFGEERFRNEIIWQYKRWSNSQRSLIPSHQTIYFYSKTGQYKFNVSYQDYSPSTNPDQILQLRERDGRNKSVYKRDSIGDVVVSSEKAGVPLGDVWDIPFLNPKAKERVSYPTQKPISLLDRIIRLTTDENDVVLDPFCGSGTTLVAAELSGRKWIGIDISQDAIRLTQERIDNPVVSESGVMKKGRESYRTADESALSSLVGIDYVPIHRNKGIDAILNNTGLSFPVLVRIQRPSEAIEDAAFLLRKAMSKHVEALGLLIRTEDQFASDFKFVSDTRIMIVDSFTISLKEILKKANKALEPTPMLVTDRANARSAPSTGVAQL